MSKNRRYSVERLSEGAEYPGYVRYHDVTVEEVKSCEEFSHFSDEEALQVVDILRRFTEIIYHYHRSRQASSCS